MNAIVDRLTGTLIGKTTAFTPPPWVRTQVDIYHGARDAEQELPPHAEATWATLDGTA